MYTAAHHHAPPSYGLGFWSTLIPVGVDVVGGLFGDDSGNMPVEQYYPAVARGELLCPGPFRVDELQRAMEDYPDLQAHADRVLALDKAWEPGRYGPLDVRGKAGAMVNWAHGGRNCAVTEGEIGGTQGRAAVEKILSTAAQRRAADASAAAAAKDAASAAKDTAVDVVGSAGAAAKGATEAVADVVGSTNPLILAALGIAGVALLARR